MGPLHHIALATTSLVIAACAGSSSSPATHDVAPTLTSRTASPFESASAEERDIADELRALATLGGAGPARCKGFLVLQFRNDTMFESGRVELSSEGAILLQRVAAVAAAMQAADSERASIYTSGPLLVAGFPPDWELSAFRAQLVANTLEQSDVSARLELPPTRCAREGTHDPSAPERRVEIQIPASARMQEIYFASSPRVTSTGTKPDF